MNELRDSVIFILLASVLSTYQMFDVLLSRTYHLTEDTRVTKLVADCELWDILPPSQPSRTLVLSCPRVDAIRIWPLPVQRPWEEGSSPSLANAILWGNTPDQIITISGTPVVTHSDIQGDSVYPGDGNINADPLFVRSPSPGGDGTWGTSDDDYGDLRLRLASPAIDAGNNAAVPPGVLTDLGGHARFVDVASVLDTGSGTPPIVDMGAYETQSAIYLPLVRR